MADAATPPDDAHPLDRIARSVRRLRRTTDAARAHSKLVRMSGIDLDSSGLQLLLTIDEAAAPMRISDLARRERLDLSVVSRKVRQLQDGGFVERISDPADARAALVQLSPAGRAGMDRLRTGRREYLEAIVADWDDADLINLATLLERFIASFEDWTDNTLGNADEH